MQTADVDQQAPEWHARACTEHNTALAAQQHPCKTSTDGRKLFFAVMRHAAKAKAIRARDMYLCLTRP
jgi:hypothetical protein